MRALYVLLIVSIAGLPTGAWAQDAAPHGTAARPWTHVQALEPGSEILLTVARTQREQRYVVDVDDQSLRVLNLTESSLPTPVADTLRSIASQHPEYFAQAAANGTIVMGRVRLANGAVYVGDERVLELQRIVQTHGRHDVAEIARRRRGRGFWGHLGPLGGFFLGGMAGGLASGVACRAVRERDRCDTGAFLTGMVGGGVVGGTYGWQAARRETEEIVYRVP